MEDLVTLHLAILLFLVALLSGFVDAIAGGGGLITLPVLLGIGLTPAQALATNKLQSSGGSFSASLYFIRNKVVDIRCFIAAIVSAFVGSALGSMTVQVVDTSMLELILPFLLLSVVIYLYFMPAIKKVEQPLPFTKVSIVVGFFVGFYDGFLGPGTGTFFTIAFVSLLGFSLISATAHAKVLNFTTNIGSLVFFILGGSVVWSLGLIMMIGQFIGARVGAKLVHTRGHKIIKPMVISVSIAMIGKLLWTQYIDIFSFWLNKLFC